MRLLRLTVTAALVLLLVVSAPSALAQDFPACPGGTAALCGPDDDDSQGDSIGGGESGFEVLEDGDPGDDGGSSNNLDGADGSDESVSGSGTSDPGEAGTSEQGQAGQSGRITVPDESSSSTGSRTSRSTSTRRSSSSTGGVSASPSPAATPTPTPTPSPTASPSPLPSPTPTEDLVAALQDADPAAEDQSMVPFFIMLAAIAALLFVYLRGRRRYTGSRSRGRSRHSFR